MAAAMFRRRTKLEQLISISILTVLYSVSLLQSEQYFFEEFGLQRLSVAFTVTAAGVILLAMVDMQHKQLPISGFFLVYALATLAYISLTGGFSLLPIPRFNFDLISASGSVAMYDQGVSKFFGLAAIFALWLSLTSKMLASRIFAFFLLCIFALLSFIGGGRGDFAIFLVVGLLMISSSGVKTFAFSVLIGAVLFVSLASSALDVLLETTAFKRIQVVLQGESFGMRDMLFFDAYNLLLNEPRCLFLGCGLSFFQEYYGYSIGLYPHNILLEALVIWGLVLVIPLVSSFAIGLSQSRRKLGVLFWAGVYFTGIGFKSGDVINSWFAMSFIIHVSSVGMMNLLLKHYPDRKMEI